MKTELTRDEKRALVARRLPKLLTRLSDEEPATWYWLDSMRAVTEREWLEVIRLAEETLTDKEELFYLIKLMQAMNEPGTIGWRSERTYKAAADQRLDAFISCIS